MSMSTIGDMRQFFLTSRNNTMLKTDLNTLVQELTTGQASDLTAHLGVSQTNLAGLDRQLDLLERFAQSNADVGQMLSTMQTVLSGVDAQRATASSALLTIDVGSSLTQIENTAHIARAGFQTTVQSLNTRYGDRTMFGGNDLDANPLSDPNEMLTELQTAVAGLTDPADVISAINTWFDAPGGGFETTGYQGDTSSIMTRPVDANQSVDINLRADDQAIRDTLKAFALGALAGDATLPLDIAARQMLQQQAGQDLLTVAVPLAGIQARLGYAEGQVEEASVRIATQQSSYGIARNELVSADPFETATRLQAVQQQLETQYTLTARLSRLSLTEYLR